MSRAGFLLSFAAAVALAACGTLYTTKPQPTTYDLGPVAPAPQALKLSGVLALHEVTAPAWIDSAGILYRLAYRNPTLNQAYATSRWIASPARLVDQRLRHRLAAAGGVVNGAEAVGAAERLRVEIADFSQVFDTPAASHAAVRLRATLQGPKGMLAQRVFSATAPAPSPDAEGGVTALARASDQAIDELVQWLASALAPAR